jgi:hypothetical protein
MNDAHYYVGAYIRGRSGKKIEITEYVEAKDKEEAGIKIRQLIEEEGWIFAGIDYIDLTE